MKSLLITILSSLSLPLFANTNPTTPPPSPSQNKFLHPEVSKNGIVAIVNDSIITFDEINRKLNPLIPQIQHESKAEAKSQAEFEAKFEKKINTIAHELIENRIDELLILKDFYSDKKRVIPQSYLDSYYSNFIQENFQGDRNRFMQYLESQKMTDRDFRDRQKEEIIVASMRSRTAKSQSEISPKKIQQFYQNNPSLFTQHEAVLLHQITLSPLPNDSQNTQLLQLAQSIIQQFNNGTPFSQLALSHSSDNMKSKGGQYGWINRSDIRKELADVAFSLDINKISSPILIDNYAFLLLISDKKPKGTKPLPEVRDQIEAILSEEASKELKLRYVQRLRKKAHIKYFI